MTESLQSYMDRIASFSLISEEKEIELAHRIAAGDEKSLAELAEANLRLVVKIAYQFANVGVPVQELVSRGNEGLMEAAGRFKAGKGAKFSSYAAWWIKQAIRNAISEHSRIVRVPMQSILKLRKIRQAEKELDSLGDEVSVEKLAEKTGLSVKVVRNTLMNVKTSEVSLELEVHDEGRSSMHDHIADEKSLSPAESLQKDDSKAHLLQLLASDLTDREREIVELRYGIGHDREYTLEEVSKIVGLTRERVRQIQHATLKKLQRML